MRFPRTLAFAALAASPVLSLTSCGDDAEGARTTLGTVQTTSYVVEDPVTTTTTTTLPAAIPEGEISPTEQIHIVVAGDSLSKISSMYGITLDALINYNAWTDGINHVILPGAEVKIPPNSQVPSATPDTQAPSGGGDTGGDGDTTSETTTPEGVGCTHTIVEGENPTKVAEHYGITLDELRAANAGNPAINTFVVGQQLSIPANGNC
jgi:LysM repeat protein